MTTPGERSRTCHGAGRRTTVGVEQPKAAPGGCRHAPVELRRATGPACDVDAIDASKQRGRWFRLPRFAAADNDLTGLLKSAREETGQALQQLHVLGLVGPDRNDDTQRGLIIHGYSIRASLVYRATHSVTFKA